MKHMEKVHDHRRTIAQAKKYCKDSVELIENYAVMLADTTQRWCCHHIREIDEHKSRQQLIDDGLYFRRPASELIFLTASQHWSLHNKARQTGVALSEEHKQHIADALNRPDVKQKLSEARKGTHWFNNGSTEVWAKVCPEGYEPGRLKN